MPSAKHLLTRPPLWLLVPITIAASIGMHLFAPALPAAAAEFGVSAARMQMAISVYLLTVGVGQLFWGPVSDSLGRRRTLVAGLSLFAAGGLAAAAATSLETLLVARSVQALGAACGMSLGRAIIRDTTEGVEMVRQLALLGLMVLLSPGLAPMLGGAVASRFGWRAIFVLLGLLGLVGVWMTVRRLPETCTSLRPFVVRRIAADYGRLACDPRFLGLAIGNAGLNTAAFAFLAAAPFVLTRQMGLDLAEVGLYAGLVMLALALGNALTSALVHRVGATRLVVIGVVLALVGAAVLLALVLSNTLSLLTFLATVAALNCGAGMATPALVARVFALRPTQTGTASGVLGAVQMAMATLSGSLVNPDVDPALSCATTLLGVVLFSTGCLALATHMTRRSAPRA
jgi:MFS transporter, DHA1 family, multidrug resistance protein